jgi:surface antigen
MMRKTLSILVVCAALGACGKSEPPPATTAQPAAASNPAGDSLIGAQIAASLGRADQAALHQTTETALETAPPNQVMPWRNAGSGNYGTVTPGQIYQVQGQYCRTFNQTIVVGGQQQQGNGKACRRPDGTWFIVP